MCPPSALPEEKWRLQIRQMITRFVLLLPPPP
jgi:hypothetical protein